jgi:hypothetical protein
MYEWRSEVDVNKLLSITPIKFESEFERMNRDMQLFYTVLKKEP